MASGLRHCLRSVEVDVVCVETADGADATVPARARRLRRTQRPRKIGIPAEKVVTVKQNPEQEQEWVQQNNLIYGALIAIGVFMVQPFLTAASLDLSAKICIVAFSVAIPLLAALVLVNRQEAFRRRRTKSVLVDITQVVAETCASAGVVAGFWHILWIAGVGMLAGGLVGVAVHSAGYVRLERDQEPTPEEGEEPGDTAS